MLSNILLKICSWSKNNIILAMILHNWKLNSESETHYTEQAWAIHKLYRPLCWSLCRKSSSIITNISVFYSLLSTRQTLGLDEYVGTVLLGSYFPNWHAFKSKVWSTYICNSHDTNNHKDYLQKALTRVTNKTLCMTAISDNVLKK